MVRTRLSIFSFQQFRFAPKRSYVGYQKIHPLSLHLHLRCLILSHHSVNQTSNHNLCTFARYLANNTR